MREEDLEGHMVNDTEKAKEEKAKSKEDKANKRAELILERDNQVRQALHLLQTWNIFSKINPQT